MAFEDVLAGWLVEQRWFAGKGSAMHDLAIVENSQLQAGEPELRHLIIAVSHGASADYYQLLVGMRRRLPTRLSHARIGPSGDGRQAYDALHDADLTKPLLSAIAAGQSIGKLQMHAIEGAAITTGLDSLVIPHEQSNTSLVYGEESILKVFRRVQPGPNPDLEVTTALARLGSEHVADPLGWIETTLDGVTTSLAVLSHYLRLAIDGWTLAATSVRDLYAAGDAQTGPIAVRAQDAGGDFAGEAHRLGAATAQVHADLAEAFGVESLGADAIREQAEQMFRKLEAAIAAVPELAKHADLVSDAYAQFATLNGPLPVQRVHGDYHLGQVLRNESGWVVLDFEGEPATPLAQRRAHASPLRDVAGMLRSFDYAARHQLIGHPSQPALNVVARDWVRRNSAAFSAGYAAAGGLDPEANRVVLRALQMEKAVYEVLYEARHRPSWLAIPLDSLAEF